MDSQQRNLWAVLFVTFGMATVSLLGRFWSRRLTRTSFWWDDYAALCAYLMALAWMVITPLWISKGLGLHIEDVTYAPVEKVLYDLRLLFYIAELLYAFALFFGKVSILCLYWRLFCVPVVELAVKVLLGCALVWIIIRLFMGVFHCTPIAYFWDASIPDGTCAIDDSKFFFGTILVHVLMDLCILSLPVVSIVRLRLPKLQKVGVTMMFLFGTFTCVAAVMIMIDAVTFDAASNDFTWNVAPIVFWATAEVNLVTVSTCLPTIKPTFYWCFGRLTPPPSKFASTTGPGTGRRSQGHYGGLSGARPSFHLRTLRDDEDLDGSTSTRWLTAASADRDPPPDLEGYERRRQGRIQTTTTCRGNGGDGTSVDSRASEGEDRGIQVRNETIVRVSYSRAEPPGEIGVELGS